MELEIDSFLPELDLDLSNPSYPWKNEKINIWELKELLDCC
jgi:hypothetical protein